MEEAGFDFHVVVPSPGAECGACSGESPEQFVARMARQKAEDVAGQLVDSPLPVTIIGCDTIAECDGRILGKPQNEEHARQILHLLRGRVHRVLSGLCLIRSPENQMDTTVESTQLEMKPLSDAEIEEYLQTDLWIGKAGAFGLQDRTGWIAVINGSESNVVGLPLESLQSLLRPENGQDA